jgi:hypothetical protein
MAYTVTNNPWSSQYNVGVGIETPCSTLHVFGAGATMRLGPYYADQDRDYLFFEAGGTNSQIITRNESMTIHNCGGPLILNPSGQCVGIGTTSAPMALTFTDSLGGKILFNNNPNNYSIGLASGVVSADSSMKFMAGCTTPGDFTFYRGSTLSMIIACTGNVGIGTTTPQVALDIRGSSEGLHMYRDGGNAPDIRLKTSNGTIASPSRVCNGNLAGQIHFEAHDGSAYLSPAGIWGVVNGIPSTNNVPIDLLFYTGTLGKNERMRITSGGSIGIGTCTPSYRLHVNGTFYAAGSSQDYKESICQYNTDSCLFMCLKPVTYQYKDEYKHLGKELKSETQIGLIAEEVAETYPELAILVKENDNDVVRNVDYEKLSIVLLAEVQKLRKEVDDLKHKQ